MKTTEVLVVQTAIGKWVKQERKKTYETLKNEMFDHYEEDGTDRRRLIFNGVEVGTISIEFDKAGWEVTDEEAFYDFLNEQGGLDTKYRLRDEYQNYAFSVFGQDKPYMFDVEEKPNADFCKLFTRLGDVMVLDGTDEIIPGIKPYSKKPKKIIIRGCEPEQVKPLLQNNPQETLKLLGGVENG